MTVDRERLKELTGLVAQWARDRGIDKSPSGAQLIVSMEELGELAHAIVDELGDEEMMDAIGDTVVTLIAYCTAEGLDFMEAYDGAAGGRAAFTAHQSGHVTLVAMAQLGALASAHRKQKDRATRLNAVGGCARALEEKASHYAWSLDACLAHAYAAIKDRTGKMVAGSFVKTADLAQGHGMGSP